MIVSTSLDIEADALYIQIAKGRVARTQELDPWTLVDVDVAGQPLGIEVIHPAREWPVEAFVDRYGVSEELAILLRQLTPAAMSGRRHPYGSPASDRGTTTAVRELAL